MISYDPILQAARDRLAEIAQERRELESFLETYKKLSTRARPDVPPPLGVATSAPEMTAPAGGLSPSTTSEIMAAVRDILNDNRKPTPFSELYDALIRRGIVISGKDPRANLSQKLSSSDEFMGRRGVGWWFTGPLPDELQDPTPPENLEE